MPTGYTSELMKKGMEFKLFVLQCARDFGALISMRDDPMDAPIPEKFEPSTYSREARAKAIDKHTQLRAMTDTERISFGESEKAKSIKQAVESIEEAEMENQRLIKMRSSVSVWVPPTDEHKELKTFMLNQIDISMNDTSYSKERLSEAEKRSPMDYFVKSLSGAARDIKYYTEEMEKEIERAEKRTEWVRQLRKSIGD